MRNRFRYQFVVSLGMITSFLGVLAPASAQATPIIATPVDSCQAVAFGEQKQPKASAVNVKLAVSYNGTAECGPGAELTSLVVQAYRFNNSIWVGVYGNGFCTPLVTTGTSSSKSCETAMNNDFTPLQSNQMYKSIAVATFTLLTPTGTQITQTATHSFHFFVYPTDHVANNSYDPVDGCKTSEWGTLIPSPRSVQFVATGHCLPTAEVFDVTARLFRYDAGWVEIASSITDPSLCQKQVSVTGGGEVRCDRPGTTTLLPAGKLYRVLGNVIYQINAQGIYVQTSNGNNYYFWTYA